MKGTILGTGNKNGYTYFIIKKEQKILQLLKDVLLKFDDGLYDFVYYMIYKNYTPSSNHTSKLKEKKVTELKDDRYNLSYDDYIIDIIFGEKKVFIISHMSKAKSNKFRKLFFENFKLKT